MNKILYLFLGLSLGLAAVGLEALEHTVLFSQAHLMMSVAGAVSGICWGMILTNLNITEHKRREHGEHS